MDLDRRKVLGTVGGLAIAGSGLAAFSGSAAASVNTYFQAHGTSVLRNDDGSVQNVNVDVDGEYSWDNLDSPANMATVSLKAKVPGKTTKKTAHSETQTANGTHGSGTFSFDNVDLTETFNDAVFEDDINYGNNNSVGNSASDAMGVQVNNLASQANVNGTSDASASSYDQLYSFDEGGHPNLDDDGTDDDGDGEDADTYLASDVLGSPLLVEVTYGDPIVYRFRLPAAFTSGSADNVPVLIDANDSGTANYQAIYHASNGVSYQQNSGGWTDVSSVSGLEISVDSTMETVTVSIDRSLISSTYRIGFRLAYGGGGASNYDTLADWYPSGTNFALYNVPRSAFRDDSDGYFGSNWTSSEYYMTESL